MKIKTKIALLFTIVCTSVMVGLSLAVLYFANERAFQDFYTRLQLRATIAARLNLHENEDVDAFEQVRNRHLTRLPQEQEYIVRIDSLHNIAQNTFGKQVPASFVTDILTKKEATYRQGYQFYKGIRYSTPRGDYAIVLSAEHTFARNFLASLKTILISVNLVAMVIIFTMGMLFSNQILAPIRKITQEVNSISATSLHKRLTVRDGKDEIAELGNTFNNMLSRLETSFETQNNFVSNASHELNTPLTAIIGEAELALYKERRPYEYRSSLQIVLNQAEKLRNITKSLLELAQSGFTVNLQLEQVHVRDLLLNVQKIASSIYPDCGVATDYALQSEQLQQLTIRGNFHLLELCISNIVLNACKYSGGEKVTLALAVTDQWVFFIVKDRGIGIPAEDMPHIFDPFFRASNVKTAKGYGIGLPLAQNIVKLHKGRLDVASKEALGTEVVVKIPRIS